ncbi:hypothetical protein M0R45_026373 [Rubus argutus]|uniref:Uncharacterized protein n=1 Tax=Rubus argutus TaxID=59490 RepID=A0AAW1WYP0_RUBAR
MWFEEEVGCKLQVLDGGQTCRGRRIGLFLCHYKFPGCPARLNWQEISMGALSPEVLQTSLNISPQLQTLLQSKFN